MIETAAHTMMCLICSQVVKTVKGDDAKQHFRRHVTQLRKIGRRVEENLCRKFEESVRHQTSCMSTFIQSNNNGCEASYRVAYHLGVAGKPYIRMENSLSDVS